uniref:SH2 domain-containing protein n=1 Tax=Oryzias sinensis TaxID=183150 RepID=A0A8C7YLH2_9TELE
MSAKIFLIKVKRLKSCLFQSPLREEAPQWTTAQWIKTRFAFATQPVKKFNLHVFNVCDVYLKTCQDADICNKAWYASACDRRTADEALMRFNKDGAFMVRKSSGHDAQQPYTLVVFYKGRVYNIPIRFMPNTQQFALGREKKGEEFFSSVSSIIENHQKNPLVLIDAQSNSKDTTKLCFPVKP